jgi:hypothetical protein
MIELVLLSSRRQPWSRLLPKIAAARATIGLLNRLLARIWTDVHRQHSCRGGELVHARQHLARWP